MKKICNTSMKRKNQNESSPETNRPCKRLKMFEIIQANTAKQENNIELHRNIAKRRNKLLTAMHLKKRYKYYCKKHDTTYLVENARRRVKESSKENRNRFIERFRTLNVSADSYNVLERENSDSTLNKYKNISNQLDEHINELKNNRSVKQISTTPVSSNTSAINNIITYDEDEDDDSDFADDLENVVLKKRRIVKCLIVKRNPETNSITFSDDEDFNESDFDDGNSDCDCYYHENLKNNFHNYKYDSSSEDE